MAAKKDKLCFNGKKVNYPSPPLNHMLFVQEPRDWTFELKCINKIIIHGVEVGRGGGVTLPKYLPPKCEILPVPKKL